MQAFNGFGPDTLTFLAGLSENNNKAWFDTHRADYDNAYIEPAKAFVAEAGERLAGLAPEIRAEPRVNGSIFRINRDIRFSKDKTPYKDHLDLWFWEGDRKSAVSGLFFRLTRDSLILGAGAHMFGKDQLDAYRAALCDRGKAAALLEIEEGLKAVGLKPEGERYAKVPRGLEFDDPRLEELSKFKALHAAHYLDHPPALERPDFVDFCIEKWRPLLPLHRWLVAM